MTKKPSKNSSRWGISPQTSHLKNSVIAQGRGLIRALFWFLVLATGFAGCERGEDFAVLDSPFPVIDQWGRPRPFRIYVPRVKKEVPLIIYFHGVMSDGFRAIPQLKNYTGSPVGETGLVEFCRQSQILLLVPDPVYTYEFLKQKASGWLPFEKECDGIEKMIDRVIHEYPVSRNHIYLYGISAGAGICHHLANRRPEFYNAILSHSQGYVNSQGIILRPAVRGPKFGVVFGYNQGDYENLIDICIQSEKIYREAGYQTVLLKNLPPKNHSWSRESNRRFWRYVTSVGRTAQNRE